MLKTFVATGFSCLAVGSLFGYLIADATRQPQNLQAQTTPAPVATISPKPLTRDELERRFTACIGKPMRLKAFTDKDLNDSLAECEALKAQS
ncbi:MAG: hypothetical protein IM328_12680 [Microcystis sp. M034S1]|jgi:hypothetical protein|uniref:hypothetical protein n=1 Tax=Microcystis sp. M034S1 TaxID=2771111 RepID=UPI002588BE6F|nr:hypothetical protein [Microcystis sp. M034S1]MCA2910188.1 hypothetical protein [Microcystis sp. M034S1]MCA6510458.1 hypothetical protein [Pseudanabaena sp. M109S1SP2A07QC]MCA6517784.1 hypothetical protein [Pseudanabaena sp. M110S1SP2A07QC]MCA6566569.1 hypothetical protein [Pseudanabaena sp. M151S2SP2A07QC]